MDNKSENTEITALLQKIEELTADLNEARAESASKEAFLSSMSHDIRTPMNAIVGMTALAKSHIDEKARVIDALDKIEVASAHLLSLINDILDMSRINSGRMIIQNELFSLSDLLHDILIIIRPQMQAKSHGFHFSTAAIEEEDFFGDSLRLRQIFVNIISNAVKYTPAGGDIRVHISEEIEDGRCVLLFSCRDNGIGMSEEFLARIFNPFERAGSKDISRIEGTGLGMSIVKRLLDAMEGSIGIESAPGQGTTVTVRVPLKAADTPFHAEALAGVRVLVIESDPELLEAYGHIFAGSPLITRIVPSSTEAITALTDAAYTGTPYQAVIIGNRREEKADIFDTASYLHKYSKDLVLLLASDVSWDEIEYRATRSGISEFIPTPLFRKTLLMALQRALGASKGSGADNEAPDLSNCHILLAEDNEINREIACELLSLTSASVTTAENGQEAVSAFLGSEISYFDLILMDIQMPLLDGYGAVAAIRASGRSDADLPIFAMTANTFAEDIRKTREAGMNGHIAKPIDITSLMQVLRQFRKKEQ